MELKTNFNYHLFEFRKKFNKKILLIKKLSIFNTLKMSRFLFFCEIFKIRSKGTNYSEEYGEGQDSSQI